MCVCVFVSQFDKDHLIILGLGESVPVDAEMACEAISVLERFWCSVG